MLRVMSLNLPKAWGCGPDAGPSRGAHPTIIYTPHPTPKTLHPLHPTLLCALHPTPYTLHPAGLADWLFEADGDAGTEAGCASAGGIGSIPFLTAENRNISRNTFSFGDIVENTCF